MDISLSSTTLELAYMYSVFLGSKRRVVGISIAAYEKAHLESFAKILIPRFDGLPKEVVRVIASFWAHAGYY